MIFRPSILSAGLALLFAIPTASSAQEAEKRSPRREQVAPEAPFRNPDAPVFEEVFDPSEICLEEEAASKIADLEKRIAELGNVEEYGAVPFTIVLPDSFSSSEREWKNSAMKKSPDATAYAGVLRKIEKNLAAKKISGKLGFHPSARSVPAKVTLVSLEPLNPVQGILDWSIGSEGARSLLMDAAGRVTVDGFDVFVELLGKVEGDFVPKPSNEVPLDHARLRIFIDLATRNDEGPGVVEIYLTGARLRIR